KRVEAHHFEIRKTLLDYDNVMSQQREVIYSLRRELMQEDDLMPVLEEFLADVLDDVYGPLEAAGIEARDEAGETVRTRLREIFNIDRVLAEDAPLPDREGARVMVMGILETLREDAPDIYKDIVRYFLLEELDRCWKEHLRNMDSLRDGIGLRGYGQKDPKLEYKREGFEMFQAMLFRIRESVFKALTRVRVQRAEEEEEQPREEFRHKEEPGGVSYSGPADGEVEDARAPAKAGPRIGRNDPCPCGSGKKYKKCCGRGK
ncbi:MAG: SEC-C domain-containing protein, partial [Desulfovibrionaceae bacterium]|nr:SEC-C domain-containing protein [Desulfovibrionaceae bacterium]